MYFIVNFHSLFVNKISVYCHSKDTIILLLFILNSLSTKVDVNHTLISLPNKEKCLGKKS